MTSDSEYHDLIVRAQGGDTKAFAELVEPIKSQVRNVVRKMVGHPEDSEEILQDALLKAWHGVRDFGERSSFATWLTSIATRTAIDFLRNQKRWRPEAQVAYANLCAQSEEMSGEVLAQFGAPDFAYEVRDHISYCFALGGHCRRMSSQCSSYGTWLICRRARRQRHWEFPIRSCAIASLRAVKALGAQIELCGDDYDTACEMAIAFSRASGGYFIHPFDNPEVIAGQGTLGVEITQQLERIGSIKAILQ